MDRRAILAALASAMLFGASTPLAKLLVGELQPVLLAAVLYLGSGIGLFAWILLRRLWPERSAPSPVAARDLPWLAAAIAFGGVIAPLLLVHGLALTQASTAALLLNLEAVFTAVLAWVVFRENVDRRVFLGMVAIVAGGVLLSAGEFGAGSGALGIALIAGACLGWAVDNNLTRKISGGDAATLACAKGLVAGTVNLLIAFQGPLVMPSVPAVFAGALVGFLGYGVSLVLFIVALRGLGTARTGAYFSVAPFFGAALGISLQGDLPASGAFWMAAGLMALGVWLHVSERHEHVHAHEPLEHSHLHTHDEHHHHDHAPGIDTTKPHVHWHRHGPMTHSHPHFPDLHHRHNH